MGKIIHLTDPHITREGERLLGLDNTARLQRALAHVAGHHADADLLVITGDLVENGAPAQYRRFRELIRDFPLPVRLLVGNHDDRDSFRSAFPEHPSDPAGFIQSTAEIDETLLVFLDTKEGPAAGRLCPQRLAWLDNTLRNYDGRRVLVFMHHPPTIGQVPHFVNMQLVGGAELAELLAVDRRVAALVCGHLHLPLSANWGGVPVFVNGGVSFRIVLNTAGPEVQFAGAPMSAGVILTSPDELAYHTDYVV